MPSRKEDVQIEGLREAARRATVTFLETAPPRGHGLVPLEDMGVLSYRRVDREYGLFVDIEMSDFRGRAKNPIALDKAPHRWLIAGCAKLAELMEVVRENARKDAEAIEMSIGAATAFAELGQTTQWTTTTTGEDVMKSSEIQSSDEGRDKGIAAPRSRRESMDAAAAAVSLAGLPVTEQAWAGEPVMGSTVDKGIYVLARHRSTSDMAARAYAAKVAADAAGEALKGAVEELRGFGEAARKACASLHGKAGEAPLPSVKIPYLDENGAERSAMVTVSQRYKVDKGIAEAREEIGDLYDACVVAEDTYVLTTKGSEILRGLLAKAGLNGKQVDAAFSQICAKSTTLSASEDYEVVREKASRKKQAVLDKFIVRAGASVKL